MPFRSVSSRGVFLACAVLVPLLADCSRDERKSPASALPSAEVVPPVVQPSASGAASASAVASVDPDLIPGARRRFVIPDDVPAPSASSSAEPEPEQPRKKIGEFKDWLKGYVGVNEPDTNPPPALGVLKDLPDLPASTLVYRKSGHLVRVSLPSGKEAALSSGPFNDSEPRWTKDGKYLFFLSTRDGAKSRIFRQKFPDGKAEPVTKALWTDDYSFGWALSEDGTKVAYVNGQPGTERDVTILDVTTGKEETLYRGEFPEDLAFARGGASLLLIIGGTMSQKVCEIDLSTRKAKVLPNGGYPVVSHPFSLQDGRVAFSASLDFGMMERAPEFFTMPAGGGAWTRLSPLRAPVGYMSGKLSPDGKKIAAERSMRQGGFGADWYTDVSIVALDGQFGKPLARAFPRPFYGLSDASWGPDSRHLSATLGLCPYFGCEPSIRSIVLIDTTAKEPRLVFVGYGTQPAFRPVVGAG